MDIFSDACLIGLHALFLGNAVYNVVYNFQADDIERAPVFFRLAQTTNIMFSVCLAQIVRQLGPLRKPRVDCEPQAFMAVFTGFTYSILTLYGALGSEDWTEDIRTTESYKYMRASVVLPLQAVFVTAVLNESVKVAESAIWMLRTMQRNFLVGSKEKHN